MDASRHDLALGSKEKRFPRKQTCLSIYSRCVNSSDRLDHRWRRSFRGASSGSRNCGYFSNRIPKQSRNGTCSITTISSSIGFICLATRRSSFERTVQSHPRGRISGHQPAAVLYSSSHAVAQYNLTVGCRCIFGVEPALLSICGPCDKRIAPRARVRSPAAATYQTMRGRTTG